MTNLAAKILSPTETLSVARLNQMLIVRLTGTEISLLNALTEKLNILCIEDGAGFKKGHFYTIGEDQTIRDTFLSHNHTDASTGGSYYDIMKANATDYVEVDYSLNIHHSQFYYSLTDDSGTFTTEVDSDSRWVQALTNESTDARMNFSLGGGRLTYAKPITMQLKYVLSHNVDLTYRMGIRCALIQNAAGNDSQMGFEGCTATSINNAVFSADGTTRSSEYLINMVQSVPFGLRLDYTPSSKIVAQDGQGTIVIKTSNLPPISSQSTGRRVFRGGIRTTNPTAKTLRLYGVRLFGSSYDSQSGVKGWI